MKCTYNGINIFTTYDYNSDNKIKQEKCLKDKHRIDIASFKKEDNDF